MRSFIGMLVLVVGCVQGSSEPSDTGEGSGTVETGDTGEPSPAGPVEVVGLTVEQVGASLALSAELSGSPGPSVVLSVLMTDGSVVEQEGPVDASGVWTATVELPDPCRELGTAVTVGAAMLDAADYVEASLTLSGTGLDLGDASYLLVTPDVLAACTTAPELTVDVAVTYEVSIDIDGGTGFTFLRPVPGGCEPDVLPEDCNYGFGGGVPYQLVLDAGRWTVHPKDVSGVYTLVFVPVSR